MNRGGNRGQGRGGGEKRKPNTPVGGQYKDQRRGLNSDEMDYDEEEEEWSVVSYNRKSPQRQQPNQSQTNTTTQSDAQSQSHQERPTFASVAAQPSSSSMQNRRSSTTSANYNPRKVLQKMFVTPAPEGPMRDEITIEVQTINGKPFKGTLTFHEALDSTSLEAASTQSEWSIFYWIGAHTPMQIPGAGANDYASGSGIRCRGLPLLLDVAHADTCGLAPPTAPPPPLPLLLHPARAIT